jgi:broad specificity phosphatase PhoE
MSKTAWYTRLVLVRHGQARSKDGLYGPDTPLSDVGETQAALVAAALAKDPTVAALYCSPLPRAAATAAPIAAACGRKAVRDARLAELDVAPAPLDMTAEGRSQIAIWKPEHRGAPNGETVREFFERVASFCEWACGMHRNEKVVLVTHAGTIDAIVRWAIGVPSTEPWTFEVEVPNASLTEIEMWPSGRGESGPPRHAVIHAVGNIEHLGIHSSDI